MAQFRITLLLLLLLNIFSTTSFAQEKKIQKKAIIKLVKDASNYRKSGNFEKSLIKSRLALHYATVIDDDYLIAECYNTIAANYNELSEFKKAIFFYKKGLKYATKTDNDTIKYKINNNLGNMYSFDKTQYNKGINYYKKSLEYSNIIADTCQIVFTKLNITWAYFDTGHFKEGFPYLRYINKYHKKYGDESTVVILNMLNAMYYGSIGENDKATSFFENAIKIGELENLKSDLSLLRQEYSLFLLKNGNYKKAYENLTLYNKITDELYNEEKLKEATVAGINLELDEYKREVDKIESEFNAKQSKMIAEQSKNKKIIIVIFSLFIICAILSYFFFQNIKLKQKNKLKDVQSKIQQNIINASIDGQEMERKKIAAFLHDNISALLSSAGLHLNVFTSQNQLQPEEIIKTKVILEEAHNQIRDLSHQLMPTLLVRFGLFYALDDLCEKSSNSIIHIEYTSMVPIKTRYNEEFEMKLYFIITELFNNIIKHSQATEAKITLEEKDNNLLIQVSDNGKGFIIQEFQMGEGFGLNQIRARINNMNGEISVHSKPDSGTTVDIKVSVINK